MRGPTSKVNSGDTVKIIAACKPVPQWAVGLEGQVERITREGGIVVNLGFRAKRKYLTCKREQLLITAGKNFDPNFVPVFTNETKDQ